METTIMGYIGYLNKDLGQGLGTRPEKNYSSTIYQGQHLLLRGQEVHYQGRQLAKENE